MPASQDAISLLFHPKKKNGVVVNPSPNKKKPVRPPVLPPANPDTQPQPEVKKSPFPPGPYQEWTLLSGISDEWRYDVMKFENRKKVEVERWQQPVRLNRKDLRRQDNGAVTEAPQAVGPMLGPDGKPVIGMDGRMVMVDAEGRPIHNNQNRGQDGKGGRGRGGGRKFQKKTRQVFLVPEETRQLRKEERYPWVIEDATGSETWLAAMEEVSKSSTHAMLLPEPNNGPYFFFYPLHRWYKFQKKPSHRVLGLEEAESLVNE
jgi:transcription initiation factor TFIIF subunit alpha